ncbi:MAG: cytidine deaminase [Planctomycetota bacterium]
MLEPDLHTLVEAARQARDRAYTPYSNFTVGAAVLCQTGEVITGVNVENASYGLSICAERVAITRAVAEGQRKFAAIAIAVVGEHQPLPCGACCQVLAEFCDLQTPVYLANDQAEVQTCMLSDFLPQPFTLK